MISNTVYEVKTTLARMNFRQVRSEFAIHAVTHPQKWWIARRTVIS
jgi:hypothetical protein